MSDLRKQVEELLALHPEERLDSRNFNLALRTLFPKVAEHYLALLDENERLRLAVRNQRGDLLCWLPDDIGADQVPPQDQFLESCRRFHAQASAALGVLTDCRTIEQLETDNLSLLEQTERLIKVLTSASKYLTEVDTREFRLDDHQDLQQTQADCRAVLAKDKP